MDETKSPSSIIRQYKEGDEIGIVDVLNGSFIKFWGSVEDWIWKHKSHPNFDPECIYVAEEDGKIVGCLHARIQDIKLGQSSIRMAFESDYAVLPTHRGSNVVLGLYDAMNKSLMEKGAVLLAGFTGPELTREFYTRLFGFFNMPTITYMKVIHNRYFKEKVLDINKKLMMYELLRKEFENLNLLIQVRLRDIPSFLVRIMRGGIFVEDGENTTPSDITIVGDQSPILKVMRGKNCGGNIIDLLRAIFTGRVKIYIRFRSGLKLYRFFRIIMQLRRISLTET